MQLKGQHSKFYSIKATVYGLFDFDGNIFYVGLTTIELDKRLGLHLSNSKINGWPYNRVTNPKIKMVRALKYKVQIKPLEILWLTGRSYHKLMAPGRASETKWIHSHLNIGIKLTNIRKTKATS
jgi:hypothetical protein